MGGCDRSTDSEFVLTDVLFARALSESSRSKGAGAHMAEGKGDGDAGGRITRVRLRLSTHVAPSMAIPTVIDLTDQQQVTFGRSKDNNVILDSTRYVPSKPEGRSSPEL
jgi:hypothetical protein